MTPSVSNAGGTVALPGSIGAALVEGMQRLQRCGVLRPRRHAELLLEAALGMERTELYLAAAQPFPSDAAAAYRELLNRRETGEPVQHIVGWAPFYGRRFAVGPGVFIPRFETEPIVERSVELLNPVAGNGGSLEVLDLCCGCGVIGLTLAAEIERARVTLADVSPEAVQFSRDNAARFGVVSRVRIIRWDAGDEPPAAWSGRFNLVTGNPPYIPAEDLQSLHPDVREGEPRAALTDGGDGLSFYRRWAVTIPPLLKSGGRLLVECGDGAAEAVADILSAGFAAVEIHRDLNGIQRVVEAGL